MSKSSQKNANDCDHKDNKKDDKDDKDHKPAAVTQKDNDDHDKKDNDDHKKDNDDKEKAKPVATTSAATTTPAQPTELPNTGVGSTAPVIGILAAVAGYVGYMLHLKRRTV
jgi:hypothetical protein